MNSTDHKRTRVELCGGLSVEIEGRRLEALIRGRQARSLFSYLVLNRERPVRREELIDALWPDRPPASPGGTLNTLVSRLRTAIGEGVVCGRSDLTLELSADAWVDIECAFAAIGRAEAALERSGWQEAISAAEVALCVAEQGFLPEGGGELGRGRASATGGGSPAGTRMSRRRRPRARRFTALDD